MIKSIGHLVKSNLAADLLQWMDHFLLLQYSETMCNLIGSQDWNDSTDFPSNYVSLFKSLGHFPFGVKLKNHLLFFPFSNLTDCLSRVKIIKTFLNSSIGQHVVDDWKAIFLSRIDNS